MKKRLVVVDISSFIFRAFYAIRMLNAPDGTPVNAVYGVLNMMVKLLEQYKPTHILVARDTSGPTFRHLMYKEYKANRSEPPDDLKPQFELVRKMIQLMQIPAVGLSDVEADDIIGSICVQWKNDFDEIIIASADKDIMQFVGEHIIMVDTMKDKTYDRNAVKEKMGVWPEQVHDYLAIVGDSSDNIPGIKGIGAKGAADLLEKFKTLDNCIANIETLPSKRYITAFSENLQDAILSKHLTSIKTDVDLGYTPEQVQCHITLSDDLLDFLRQLGFKNAIQKLSSVAHTSVVNTDIEIRPVEKIPRIEFSPLCSLLQETNLIIISPVYAQTHPAHVSVSMLGIYIPDASSFFVSADQEQIKEIVAILKSRSSGHELFVVSDEFKLLLLWLKHQGVNTDWRGMDIPAAHYLLEPDAKHSPVLLMEKYLQIQASLPATVDMLTLGDDELQRYGLYLSGLFQLYKKFQAELERLEILKVYDSIDAPVIPVLADLEYHGVLIDKECLKVLENEFEQEISDIENTIFETSGEQINLKSPKQVAGLLFDKLKMPIIKKTKTGASTDSEVLEELAAGDYGPIPELMLQHRETEKLLSTYIRTLPELMDATTKRVHTSFGITTAATGRLSSTNPNLQNIPIRSERGRKIRKAFIAQPGYLLLGADYSQIELRLLAHLSEDKTMVSSFLEGRDIHAQTAAEVMGIAIGDVTRNDRSIAKAVNFGLMYGQSSFGLSRTLKISRNQARDYIEKYFTRFHKVKSFLDSLKEEAEKNGHSTTMFGRKRFLPDINSTNRTIKSQAERVAVNSPIQGAAADLIKLAMRAIWDHLQQSNLKTKMILQVHDELIFEVPEKEVELISSLVKMKMENIAKLKVPLVVDVCVGENWFDLE
jgi:DNA polymerase-1